MAVNFSMTTLRNTKSPTQKQIKGLITVTSEFFALFITFEYIAGLANSEYHDIRLSIIYLERMAVFLVRIPEKHK